MPKHTNRSSRPGTTSRTARHEEVLTRTRVVWLSFFGAMSLLIGILSIGDGRLRPTFMAANASVLGLEPDQARNGLDRILAACEPADRARWKAVVIHHSGTTSGDLDHLDRQHRSAGIPGGLAYHFAIGNGRRLDLGLVAATPRWEAQGPAVGTSRPDLGWTDDEVISICLIGRGNDRPFETEQIESLRVLVGWLQEAFDIPTSSVHLASEVAPSLTGPGVNFPAVRFFDALVAN